MISAKACCSSVAVQRFVKVITLQMSHSPPETLLHRNASPLACGLEERIASPFPRDGCFHNWARSEGRVHHNPSFYTRGPKLGAKRSLPSPWEACFGHRGVATPKGPQAMAVSRAEGFCYSLRLWARLTGRLGLLGLSNWAPGVFKVDFRRWRP